MPLGVRIPRSKKLAKSCETATLRIFGVNFWWSYFEPIALYSYIIYIYDIYIDTIWDNIDTWDDKTRPLICLGAGTADSFGSLGELRRSTEGFVWKSGGPKSAGWIMVFPQVPSLRLPFWDIPHFQTNPVAASWLSVGVAFRWFSVGVPSSPSLNLQFLRAFCLGGWQAHRLCGWSLLRVRRKVMASMCGQSSGWSKHCIPWLRNPKSEHSGSGVEDQLVAVQWSWS